MCKELDELNSYVKSISDKYRVTKLFGAYLLYDDNFDFDIALVRSENPQDIKDFFDGDDVEGD